MKHILFLLLFLSSLLWAEPCLAQQDNSPKINIVPFDSKPWKDISPQGGSFTVAMPGIPAEQVNPIKAGQIELHTSMLAVTFKGSLIVLGASYGDFPIVTTDKVIAKQFLDKGRDGGLAATKSRLISEKDIFLDEYPGREIKSETDNLIITARIYLVGKRLYQLVVVSPKEPTASKEIIDFQTTYTDKFFSSFKLTPS